MVKIEFKDENGLYNSVVPWLCKGDKPVVDVVERRGVKLYLIGERHKSLESIAYVHDNIVPKMKIEPYNWLLFREGLNSYSQEDQEAVLESVPHVFYFQRLPKLMGIPGYDPVGSIFDPKTQELVSIASGLSIDQIRGWCITTIIEVNGNKVRNSRELDELILQKLKISSEEASRATEFCYNQDIHEELMNGWNQLARTNLDRVLDEHPERRKALLSVGTAHLPAFFEKYTYIGLK